MKNILFILIIVCFSCEAQQQQIIPLGTKGFHIEGAYYKDISNDLDSYIGTWRGIFENKTFIITFTKIKRFDTIGKYYDDSIMGRYKMLDSNGNQLYSTYNLQEENAKVISLGFVNSTKAMLRLFFNDSCIEGQIILNFENSQKTQIHWNYRTQQTLVTDDSGCVPFNEMPRGEFTLTKQ